MGKPITSENDKMIDLSGAKVGDEFIDDEKLIHKVVLVGDLDIVTIANYPNGEYHASFRIDNARVVEGEDAMRLVSKHETRHWLKDLPDADLFVGNWLAESNGSGWFCHENEPNREDGNGGASFYADSGRSVNCLCLKMPNLTGEQWKDSKISIDELRAWQKQNKTRGE